MSEISIACILKYLVKGVEPNRDAQHRLQQELLELLRDATSVVVLPVVQGFSIEIEMQTLKPFSRTSFEPYVAEHVLPEAVQICCRPPGDIQLQLLKAHYA